MKKDSSKSGSATSNNREAVQRRTELKVQSATVVTICQKIGKYQDKVKRIADDMLSGTNDGREIGLLINGFVDKLPGKRMTPDFWEQNKAQFTVRGKQLSLEEFNWFVRLAKSLPEPATNLREAFAARQMIFPAAGFEMIADRPPGTAHEPAMPYNEFLSFVNYAHVERTIKKLELDPNYGPVDRWPAERKAVIWAQAEPLFDLLCKLKPV